MYPFISNPTSPKDSIRIDVLIQRLEERAEAGSGQYFEVFDYQFTLLLKQTLDLLQRETDKDVFLKHLAENHNIQDIDETLTQSKAQYDSLLKELYEPHDD